MSGGLGSLAADASIPLKAGAGVTPFNPLQSAGQFADTLGKFNELQMFPGKQQLQQQAINGGALDLARAHNTAAAAWMAPFLALPPEQQTRANLTDMAARGEAAGIATGTFLNSVANVNGEDGPAFGAGVAPHIIARAQPAEKAVGAISPTPGTMTVGGQIIPTLTAAPGMAGQGVPNQSAPGFQLGYTPSEQLGTVTRPATQADVDQSGGKVSLGQPLMVPATTVPATAGFNPGPGGARIAPGALGPGGYHPPDLTRLGPAYQAPGASAGAAGGSRVMTGPDGKKWTIPAAGVAEAMKHGYR